MSFYTALTGLNGAQADISATSNNIANVGTTGFKRSRAEFGDIFATSPLQNASSSIGSGAILKGIKQQFTQGNIASSLNALDLAISGQGFFSLKPSLTSTQTVFTRNGSFNVDNDRYVVDSAGQYLMTYPVNADGSVTAKDLDSAVPLQLPVTSGEPNATSNIQLGVNVPADAPVIPNLPEFADGYTFNPNDPNTYTNSTSITIFDDLGNPTIATIYFIKTQTASAEDPTNKYDTRLVINGTVIQPDLVSAVDQSGKQIFVDRFGNQTTEVPDDNYFLEGKGSPLYKLDDLKTQVPSQPAQIRGEQSSFDFGEEGDKLVEIVTDPLLYQATRDAGKTDSDLFWGKDFLLVNVDDGDAPVSIDLRPGKYNATQLADEVERAINAAYGDDKKFQIVQNVDDELTIDLFKVGADGTPVGLGTNNRISVDLLQETSVSQLSGIDINGASPDFTKDEFLVHTQERINATLNEYIYNSDGTTLGAGATTLGVDGRIFTRASGQVIDQLHPKSSIIEVSHYTGTNEIDDTSTPKYLSYSYFNDRPSLTVFDDKTALEAPSSNQKKLSYDATQNTLSIYVKAPYSANSATIQLQGANLDGNLNGRTLRVLDADGTTEGGYTVLKVDTSDLALSDTVAGADSEITLLFNPASDVEAFFEGAESGTEGVLTTFNSRKIVLREIGAAATRKVTDTSFDNAFVIDSTKNEGKFGAITALGLNTLVPSAAESVATAEIRASFSVATKAAITITAPATPKADDEFTITLDAGPDQIVTFKSEKLVGTAEEATFALTANKISQATGNITRLTIGSASYSYVASVAGESLATIAAGLTSQLPTSTPYSIGVVGADLKVLYDAGDRADETTLKLEEITYKAEGVVTQEGGSLVEEETSFAASSFSVTTGTIMRLTFGSDVISYTTTSTDTAASIATELNTLSNSKDFTVTYDASEEDFVVTAKTVGALTTTPRTLEAVTQTVTGTITQQGTDPSTIDAFAAIKKAFDEETQEVGGVFQAKGFTMSSTGVISRTDGLDFSITGSAGVKVDSTSLDMDVALSTTSGTASGAVIKNVMQSPSVSIDPNEKWIGSAEITITLTTSNAGPELEFTLPTTSKATLNSDVQNVFNNIANTNNFTLSVVNGEPVFSRGDGQNFSMVVSSSGGFDTSNLNITNKAAWVDEKNPPIKVSYDDVNQRLQFTVDRTVLGSGTPSNFNSFTISGAAGASDTNGLGIPDGGNTRQVLIRGGEMMSAESFIADGEEIQLNDKRFGIQVEYNSDTKSFSVLSGTTGETISTNGAIGVDQNQKASNIQIGRRTILSSGNTDPSEAINLNTRIIGSGENALFGFGATRTDYVFASGRGLASEPAIASGRAAQSDLTEVFRLTAANNENIFNVSVNGIAGVIEIPPGNYVGTTLAAALEERVNQIADPETGVSVGGVTARYSAASNSFTFTTGTTGDTSTIKVKGTARLGLDDVPLGVGSVPKIFNLVQATNEDGLALFVDADGNVVTSPPDNLVTGYYPLYIDEGELTFDKTGKLISPQNLVRFEQQADGFSISLDVDFSASSQLAQPFSVLSVQQDGFTSGRLDGIEIDSSGTIRANYTNGQNNPLGKIVIASFNNQNGLKQIGNATYVETAVSGRPQVGEAGAEGFGTIQSGSLERSNVDITEELVNLITAQRNYQASAKAIETTTSLTQTIINIRM